MVRYKNDPDKPVFLKLHRVAFAIMTGAWPIDEVDHINRDRQDNKWSNLRQSTSSENKMNKKKPERREHTGIRPNRCGFEVMIGNRYVGHYGKIEEAIDARKRAEVESWGSGQVRRGRPPGSTPEKGKGSLASVMPA